MSRNLDRHMSHATRDLQPPNANIVVATQHRLQGLIRSVGEPIAKTLLVNPPPVLRLPWERRGVRKTKAAAPNGAAAIFRRSKWKAGTARAAPARCRYSAATA
ncbi:hypothetical protein ACFB49_19070 [Sphingomonas sp. DBB INV C78]|uniref:hypothetical protein n=1 Tax=Sphingomonas sp. DBB INV C78 TaxID=3349434 RepID=UPI0036D30D0B